MKGPSIYHSMYKSCQVVFRFNFLKLSTDLFQGSMKQNTKDSPVPCMATSSSDVTLIKVE